MYKETQWNIVCHDSLWVCVAMLIRKPYEILFTIVEKVSVIVSAYRPPSSWINPFWRCLCVYESFLCTLQLYCNCWGLHRGPPTLFKHPYFCFLLAGCTYPRIEWLVHQQGHSPKLFWLEYSSRLPWARCTRTILMGTAYNDFEVST